MIATLHHNHAGCARSRSKPIQADGGTINLRLLHKTTYTHKHICSSTSNSACSLRSTKEMRGFSLASPPRRSVARSSCTPVNPKPLRGALRAGLTSPCQRRARLTAHGGDADWRAVCLVSNLTPNIVNCILLYHPTI